MQTKSKLFRIIFTIMLGAFLTVSCSPEDGETGPIGPAGPQGEQGPAGTDGVDGTDGADGAAGEQGEQGEPGEPGTANVIFSGWIDSEFDNDIASVGAGFDIDVEELTQENIDGAAILVYGRNTTVIGTPDVFALPFITNSNQYNYRIESVGVLRITIASLDASAIGVPFFEDYRFIIIPGENPANSPGGGGITTKESKLDYTKMSYQEVMQHFNIQE